MQLYLDGNDWFAQYFISQNEVSINKPRTIYNMFMDSARTAGVIRFNQSTAGMLQATVPGCDRSILLENNEIDDPYYARNVDRSRWSEKAEWAFRKEFTLPEEWKDCKHISLIFHGAGYKAAVFLNDEYLGDQTGMFHKWEFDVSKEIRREGKNVLALIFDSAPQASPDHRDDAPAEFAYFHHCQMSFGWDWARTLVPTGIFDHVELRGSELSRVRDCSFATEGKSIKLHVEIGTLEDCEQTLTVNIAPKNCTGKELTFQKKVTLTAGKVNEFDWAFDYPEAEMWYPNGYGAQPLYTLTLSMPGDEWSAQVGFRDLKMIRNKDSQEEAYPLTFSVNGKAVFTRGINWVPADMIFSRIDAALYDRQVRMAKEAGFNLFRVWGGGLVEKDEFYAACDKYGILVWQEFPHACSQYPTDVRFIEHKAREGEAIIRKLRNHVSMAMYCGGNEVLYYGEIPYHPVYVKYGELVNKLVPGMPYHISSPDLSRPGERHHGPWVLMEHSFWNAHNRALASEFGCAGWTELESIEKFIPANDPCPHGQSWKYHFTIDCPAKPLKPLLDDFQPESGNRRQMCDMTMFAQADQLGYVMEHYRMRFPVSSGCYIWQYNESWPTNSYSIIDFYSRPKMAYYRLKNANAPVMIFMEDDSWHIKDNLYNARLSVVSDHEPLKNAKLTIRALDVHGTEIFKQEYCGDYPQGVSRLGEINIALDSPLANGLLLVKLIAEVDGRIVFDNERLLGVPDFSKALKLAETTLEYRCNISEVENNEKLLTASVTNIGKTAALFVRADLPENELYSVYWLDNYRLIMPGETREFQAVLTAGTTPGKLTLRGWNA